MSGYKSGYSEAHSPYYDAGQRDGQHDVEMIAACPPSPPLGPDPDRQWSAMYNRGYIRAFKGAMPHSCDKCNPALRREREQRERAEMERQQRELAARREAS